MFEFSYIDNLFYRWLSEETRPKHSYKLSKRNKAYWLYTCKHCGRNFKVKIKEKVNKE